MPSLQSGVTLVELMVSLAIGLILMGGMVQILKTNQNAYRYNSSMAEMQDNGNYALDFVTNQISQIGFVPNWINYSDADHNGDGDKDRRDLEFWAYGATASIAKASVKNSVGDAIDIDVLADPSNGDSFDCVGTRVVAPGAFVGPTGMFGIVNTLAVVKYSKERSALTCNGVEVAEGIENMQILYGVDTPDPVALPAFAYDGRVDIYQTLDQIVAAGLQNNILTVRIALLVASSEQSRAAINTKSYDLLGTIVPAENDNKQRSVYTATIRLRNRCAKFTGSSLCA